MQSPPKINGSAPIAKVAYPIYTGAIATILIFGLKRFANFDLPAEVATAIVVILCGIVGYQTPLRGDEVV